MYQWSHFCLKKKKEKREMGKKREKKSDKNSF